MTKKLTYKDYQFEVDTFANKKIYSLLTSDSKVQKKDTIINFYLTNRQKFLSGELLNFFDLTQIDFTKENEIFHYNIDNNQIVIEGWYDIVGKIFANEQVSFYWDTDISTTNVYFNNGVKNAIRKEFNSITTFRVDFSIVIPVEFVRTEHNEKNNLR